MRKVFCFLDPGLDRRCKPEALTSLKRKDAKLRGDNVINDYRLSVMFSTGLNRLTVNIFLNQRKNIIFMKMSENSFKTRNTV